VLNSSFAGGFPVIRSLVFDTKPGKEPYALCNIRGMMVHGSRNDGSWVVNEGVAYTA